MLGVVQRVERSQVDRVTLAVAGNLSKARKQRIQLRDDEVARLLPQVDTLNAMVELLGEHVIDVRAEDLVHPRTLRHRRPRE